MTIDELTRKISELPPEKYWRFIAETDTECCAQCHSYSGRIFSDNEKPKLPLHPNCRCRLMEVDSPETVLKPQKALSGTGSFPNQRYISEGAVFTTDKQGRVRKAIDELKNHPVKRNRRNQKIAAKMGKPGDEGGHLIPARYGGSGDLINLLPQSRTANRSLIKKIENEMGKALKAGKKVEYTVIPHYPDSKTLRPDKFTIRYKIDGVENTKIISNDWQN
ncbi:MAG: DNA/RNA non-specific endonuclease [Victivallaceae bacterium]|nr:DNA/RNA non-specific endonuclease [Victivallaceae bacterium]